MQKPSVLLLHGALGSKSDFARLVPFLIPGTDVHTLDFEGHGSAAPRNRPFRAEHFVENVLDYLKERELALVDLFGYSMGGHVALRFCMEHPERVRRLFTFATKFHWTPENAAKEASHLDADAILSKVPRLALDLEQRHPAAGWKAVLSKTREMTLHQGRETLMQRGALSSIEQLVRVSVGDCDKMVTLEETIAVFRQLPAAQLQVFPSTSHHLGQMDMQMLAGAMISFFSS